MGKYYKFPRRYYNRNKVRKPLKPKHILQLLLLSVVFYLLCSWLLIGTYRAGSDSMSPWCSADDKLIAVRTWCTTLDRGDVVISAPSFYRTAPFWLRAVDSVFQVCTFRTLSLAEFFGVGMFRGALRDGLDADFGCNLAGCMATHAVSDDEQRGSHDERILVLLADATDVGAAAELGNRTCTRAFSGTI